MSHLVSICVPTYNGEKFLLEAFDSIKKQTYKNIEVIISDDSSSDKTLSLAETFRSEVNFPVKIFNHINKKLGDNWNNCVINSNGDYIKFLFQDDLLYPNCIEEMINLAKSDIELGLIYSKRKILTTNNSHYDGWINSYSELHTGWNSLDVSNSVLSGRQYLKDENLLRPPLNKIGEPTSTLINRNVFRKVGLFNTNLQQTIDIEFWYRIMPHFKVGFIDDELVAFRLHENQATWENARRKVDDFYPLYKALIKNIFKYLQFGQKKYLIKKLFRHSVLNKIILHIKFKYFNKLIN